MYPNQILLYSSTNTTGIKQGLPAFLNKNNSGQPSVSVQRIPGIITTHHKLIAALKKYIRKNVFPSLIKERGVVEAYDLWAENYDAQPGNLMLDLDEILFSRLINDELIKGRSVADIGCGTGRHWEKLFAKRPAVLTGFDVSPGMLNKLNEKFPDARTCVIADNHFAAIGNAFFDVIISTLTMAHIENLEEALQAWSRILKKESDIIITDFHPAILAEGGKRTFGHKGTQIAVQNFVHTTDAIKDILADHGFDVAAEEEISIDASVKHYYQAQNAMHVYEKYKGFPAIYGIHFRRL